MKKPNKVRDRIFAAADLMRKHGIVPTTINIRGQIGGSQSTASKYLRQWRDLYDCETDFSPKQIQRQLEEQHQINKKLTLELLNSSTMAESERVENAKLRSRVLELEIRVEEKVLANQELSARNMQSEASLKNSFDTMLTALTEQLRAINAQAIAKVQEAGQHFDEKIMDAKLEVRELKEQLQARDRELKKLQSVINAQKIIGSI